MFFYLFPSSLSFISPSFLLTHPSTHPPPPPIHSLTHSSIQILDGMLIRFQTSLKRLPSCELSFSAVENIKSWLTLSLNIMTDGIICTCWEIQEWGFGGVFSVKRFATAPSTGVWVSWWLRSIPAGSRTSDPVPFICDSGFAEIPVLPGWLLD